MGGPKEPEIGAGGDVKPGTGPGAVAGLDEGVRDTEELPIILDDVVGVVGEKVDDVFSGRNNVLAAVLDGFSGYEVGGRRIEDWVGVVDKYYREKVESHGVAIGKLGDVLRRSNPSLDPKYLDLRKVCETEIPREVVYSGKPDLAYLGVMMAGQEHKSKVNAQWEQDNQNQTNRHHFMSGIAARGDRYDAATAISLPRMMIRGDNLGTFNLRVDEDTKIDDVLARILNHIYLFFAASSRKRAEWGSKPPKDSWIKSGTDIDDQPPALHRVSHVFLKLAGFLAGKLGIVQNQLTSEDGPIESVLPGDDPKSHFKIQAAYSLLCKRQKFTQAQAREFISMNLSLIFPDKDGNQGFTDSENGKMRFMANEDMIIMNLMVLAKDFGLYDEFEEIFKAMHYYRRIQNIRGFHWEPENLTKDPGSQKTTLKWIVGEINKSKKPPVVVTFGPGDGLLEAFLLSRTNKNEKVEKIYGIDVDYDSDKDRREESGDGRMVKLVIGVKRFIRQDPARGFVEDDDMIGHIKTRMAEEGIPKGDLVIATDCLHETSKPKPYGDMFFSFVKEGGWMYLSDPAYSETVDNVTPEALHKYDKTRWRGSMMCIEDLFDLLDWYIRVRGGFSPASFLRIAPGEAAGNNDAFSRFAVAIHKKPGDTPSYPLPAAEIAEWSKDVENDEAIFNVWPLNLVPEHRREDLLKALIKRMKRNPKFTSTESLMRSPSGGKIQFKELKKTLIEKVVDIGSGGDEGAIAKQRLESTLPFPKDKTMLRAFGATGTDSDLSFRNFKAAEVRVIISLVNEILDEEGLEPVEFELGTRWS
ncbi:MAG: hypothetical protein WC285_03815 [Candidatus Gracilibacteria bacterium]|jgi:hypothetical protein